MVDERLANLHVCGDSLPKVHPMMKLDFNVHFDASVERVFPYLAEPDKWLEFTPALIERTLIDGDPTVPGARWRSADKIGPLTVRFEDTLLAFEPNQRVKFAQSEPWNSWVEFTFVGDGNQCTVHVHFEAKPTGKIWWMGLMPNALATRIYRDDFDTLIRLLDSSFSG